MCCIWPFFKCCVTCVLFPQLFIFFCFKRKLRLFLLHKALKCNKESKRETCRTQVLLFLLKHSVKIYKKEPCGPFLFCPGILKYILELQMWDQVLVLVDMKTFSTRGSRKIICGGHRVRKLGSKCGNDTEAALYFSLWGCHLIQTEKRHPADFSSRSVFAGRQSNMNFSGFEKREKKTSCQGSLSRTNTQLCTHL